MATPRSLLLLALVAGCVRAEPAPPPAAPAPALEEVAQEPLPEPEPEPQMTLQQRREEPFAVVSRGRPASRPARSVVVLRPEGDRPAAAPERDEPAAPPAAAAPQPPAAAAPRAAVAREERAPEPENEPEDEEALAAARREALEAVRAAARAGRGDGPAASPREAERPAAPAPAAREAGRAERPTSHTVAYGETWLGIALRYGLSWTELAAANPGVDPERLVSGRTLRVPAAREGGAREERAAAAEPRRHTVGRGDTLSGIARRYGVSAERIRRANDLDGDRVRLGEVLLIPPAEGGR